MPFDAISDPLGGGFVILDARDFFRHRKAADLSPKEFGTVSD